MGQSPVMDDVWRGEMPLSARPKNAPAQQITRHDVSLTHWNPLGFLPSARLSPSFAPLSACSCFYLFLVPAPASLCSVLSLRLQALSPPSSYLSARTPVTSPARHSHYQSPAISLLRSRRDRYTRRPRCPRRPLFNPQEIPTQLASSPHRTSNSLTMGSVAPAGRGRLAGKNAIITGAAGLVLHVPSR